MQSASDPAPGTPAARPPEDRASILIVDDREENLVALEETLHELGQDVVRARSGHEALRLLLDRDFAVILLDVCMPDMDGIETASLIRRRPRTRSTPIILLTAGNATAAQIARGYHVGAVDYIFKPYMPEVLRAKVAIFLELFRKSEELRAGEYRYKTLVRNIPGAVYRRGAEPPWRMLFVSDAIEWISGFSPFEFVGRSRAHEHLIVPEDRAGFDQTMSRSAAERMPYALDYRIVTRDGRVRWVHDKGQAIPGTSTMDGVLFDITDRKQAEEGLRLRTRELADTNRMLEAEVAERRRAEEERNQMSAELLQGQKLQAIGQLAAGIAHEINNPTAYILSNVRTIQNHLKIFEHLLQCLRSAAARLAAGESAARIDVELDALVRETQAEFLITDFRAALQDSQIGAEKIRDIVTGLREFAHRDPRELKQVDLRDVLEGAVRITWNEIKYKAEIQREFGDVPPVLCYPQQIEQVFINLLLNAAQSITDKGTIRIRTALDQGLAFVGIRDTGCGIPPENLSRLFEPFFTTKCVGKGTGLGLHVAYKIVSGHGGRIEAQWQVGEGTEFMVRLPIQNEVPAAAL